MTHKRQRVDSQRKKRHFPAKCVESDGRASLFLMHVFESAINQAGL